MSRQLTSWTLCVGMLFAVTETSHVWAQEAAPQPVAQRQPKAFAIIFNLGYGGDHLPQDPPEFEKMVVSLKAAHFNVILGQYEPTRIEICRKHGLLWMVDLLAPPHHVFKNVEGAQKLCESLRDNPTIYGYHLWSDNIGETYPGRTRDVGNVQRWDPTHPAYVGCTSMSRVNRVEGMDIFGYYDFHWKRGSHWTHLLRARDVAVGKKIPFLRYDDAVSGLIGKGNVNRVGYTWATSIPFGLKGYTYHYTGGIVRGPNWELDALGEDLKKVNGRLAAAGDELMNIGLPVGVFSAPITKTAKNDPTGMPPAVPGGLSPVPADHWFQIASGEVLVGQFSDGERRDVLVFATHNPYEPQSVTLRLPGGAKAAEVFRRSARKWEPLPLADNTVSFTVEEAAVDLVRFVR